MPSTNFYAETYTLRDVLDWDLDDLTSVRAALAHETRARLEAQFPAIMDALVAHEVHIWDWADYDDEYGTVTFKLYADQEEYLDAIRTIPLEGEED